MRRDSRKWIRWCVCCSAMALLAGLSIAQEDGGEKGLEGYRLVLGEEPAGMGGGSRSSRLEGPELSATQRAAIRVRLDAQRAQLAREKRLLDGAADAPLRFGWPLRLARGLSDYDYHGISNFVDQDADYPDHLLDYECGDRTYDQDTGYNHKGTDFFLTPHPWLKMEHSEVIIVAAADGQILGKDDGNSDHNCSFTGDDWNAVYLQHADGSETWYGHMKLGSLTTKAVGEFVAEGEYLGVVGSSGNSTGPHLHFEVYDPSDQLIDPFEGSCNHFNSETWWSDQRPYNDSKLNKLTVGDAVVEFPACPGIETPHSRANLDFNTNVYFTAYYHDQLAGQNSHYVIRRPDGTVFREWDHSSSEPHYGWSWWYWFWYIEGIEEAGHWSFEVTYLGETYRREFVMGVPRASGRTPQFPVRGALLELQRASGGDIHLSWGASCVDTDDDFAIYEGSLGSFESHQPLSCTTSGALAATVTPSGGNRYYLVAARNADREGSLGMSSDGVERSAGPAPCLPRDLIACP